MKAIKVEAFGGPEMLSLTTVEAPVLKENEVMINVESSGVGTVDVLFRKGLFPGLHNAGFIPGMEVAGIVSAVGAQVSEEWIGKHVYSMSILGGYAEQVAVSESALVQIPENLSGAQAVSLGINALVAHFSLQRARLSPGNKIFIRGAAGGIGSLAVQFAVARQYEISVAATTSQKREKLENIGVRNFVDLSQSDVPESKFDAVIDPVAGSDLDLYLSLLNDNGIYVLNGAAAGFPADTFGMDLLKRFQKSLTFACFSLNSVAADDIRLSLSQLFQDAANGNITPFISESFPLVSAAAAHQLLESQTVFGKIVLKV